MKNKFSIEVIVNNHESVISARIGGADKIELCSSLIEGALTPSIGFIKFARENFDSEINVMVRPRGGDFLISDDEIFSMIYDIKALKKIGVDGIVIGALNINGKIDDKHLLDFIEESYPLNVTFNRAFDVSKCPYESIETLIRCNCARLLTAGLQNKAEFGVDVISVLIQRYGKNINIVPGGGINETNIQMIAEKTQAREFHINVPKVIKSSMRFQKENIKLNGMPEKSDYERMISDSDKIIYIKQLLNSLSKQNN